VIRLLGGWVRRQAAERGSTVHEPSDYVPPTSTLTAVNLQRDLYPLFLKGSAERE